MTARVLVVEDNADLAAGLEYNLKLEGYDVRVAEDGREGIVLARDWSPHLVVLDLMLPGVDGYEVLRRIRSEGSRVPVMILTARGEEADKVRGFRLDAVQYVTKPFGVLEFLERVGALLRRSGATGAVAHEPPLRFGSIAVDVAARAVTRDGASVALTPKAFDLLLALARRDGAVATRVELLREVWGYGAFVLSRTVDTHVAELRRKLEDDPANPRHILTVWKAGYRLQR